MSEAIKAAVEALEHAKQAISTWVLTYAPEYCNDEDVKKARSFLFEEGGTLLYTGKVHSEIMAALEALRPIAEGKSVIVPANPTEAMIKKGFDEWVFFNGPTEHFVEQIYRAMIQASNT